MRQKALYREYCIVGWNGLEGVITLCWDASCWTYLKQ